MSEFKIKRKGEWMQTYTGKAFWPLDPRQSEVELMDIAHALSMNCRYNGHTNSFYSVAEHSVLVSRHVPPLCALHGLLHDASEAYISDIIRPVKNCIQGYDKIEKNLEKVIFEKFNIDPNYGKRCVKKIDDSILVDEKNQLMPNPPMDWKITSKGLSVQLNCWNPKKAREMFIIRFYEIQAEKEGLSLF